MKLKVFGAASAALLLSAASSFGATLVIDTFDTAQTVTDVPSSISQSSSQLADAGVLGGYRDLQAVNTDFQQSSEDATKFASGGGLLTFSNIAFAAGSGYLTYDGDDDPTSVDTTGLGGVNLAIGDNAYFAFDVAAFDLDVEIAVTVWDMFGKVVTYSETLSEGFNPNLTFAEFSGDADFDWTQVGALQFFVSSSDTVLNVDGALYSIEIRADDPAPIPLPASALLLTGALAGLGALRRRTARKAA